MGSIASAGHATVSAPSQACVSSPPPRLSPSQKAYRDNPDGFLARIKARAESLFQDGYTVSATDTLHAFVVAYHAARDGQWVEYVVCPLQGTCSCPFQNRQLQGEYLGTDATLVTCKHLLGLSLLVRATCQTHAREGNISACCHLWQHWMITQAEKRRQRIAKEKDQERKQQHGSHNAA